MYLIDPKHPSSECTQQEYALAGYSNDLLLEGISASHQKRWTHHSPWTRFVPWIIHFILLTASTLFFLAGRTGEKSCPETWCEFY